MKSILITQILNLKMVLILTLPNHYGSLVFLSYSRCLFVTGFCEHFI